MCHLWSFPSATHMPTSTHAEYLTAAEVDCLRKAARHVGRIFPPRFSDTCLQIKWNGSLITSRRNNVYREALPAAYELQLGNGKTAIWRNFDRHDAPVAMCASLWHLERIHAKVSVGGGIWRYRQDRGFQPVLPVV